MDKITTATKRELETDYVAYSPLTRVLYIRLYNTDYPTVASVFSNPEETSALTYGEETYTGFTSLTGIIKEDTCLRVNLEKQL